MLVEWLVETTVTLKYFLEPGGISEGDNGEETGLWFRFLQEDDGEIPELVQQLVDIFDARFDKFLATGEV